MRSRVVPMRDMREKFGAEVKAFPYAFVLKSHHPGWDTPAPDPLFEKTKPPSLPNLPAAKTMEYIEVKLRSL